MKRARISRHGRNCRLPAALLLAVCIALASSESSAQQTDEEPPESFDIGLSSSTIGITSDFNGETLTVFGALGEADSRIQRQQRYDIVVALFGPRQQVVVREKQRFFGIWINRDSETISSVPVTYSLASTRPLRDIASPETLDRLSLGIATLRLDGRSPRLGQARPVSAERAKFEDALRQIKTRRGLYSEAIAGVRYLGPSLFRADLMLPAEVPVGKHVARAYLFREGKVIRQASRTLTVEKVGFEARIDSFASSHGIIYGAFAVALAFLMGWLGRVIFKRD